MQATVKTCEEHFSKEELVCACAKDCKKVNLKSENPSAVYITM